MFIQDRSTVYRQFRRHCTIWTNLLPRSWIFICRPDSSINAELLQHHQLLSCRILSLLISSGSLSLAAGCCSSGCCACQPGSPRIRVTNWPSFFILETEARSSSTENIHFASAGLQSYRSLEEISTEAVLLSGRLFPTCWWAPWGRCDWKNFDCIGLGTSGTGPSGSHSPLC